LAKVQIDTVGMGTVSGRTDTTIYSPVVGDDFAESQLLELTVTPDPGWEFSLWSGALTGNNTRPFLFPSRDSRVTATFKPASVFSTVDDFNTASWVGGIGWSGAWTSTGTVELRVSTTPPGSVAELRGPSAGITRTLGVPLYEATLSFGFDLDRTGGNDVASVEIFNGITINPNAQTHLTQAFTQTADGFLPTPPTSSSPLQHLEIVQVHGRQCGPKPPEERIPMAAPTSRHSDPLALAEL
jgi:hypothetical protein